MKTLREYIDLIDSQQIEEGWWSDLKGKMQTAVVKGTLSGAMASLDKLINGLQQNRISSDWIHGGQFGHLEGIELSDAIALTKNPELDAELEDFIFNLSHWPENNRNTDINLTKNLLMQANKIRQALAPYNDRVQQSGQLDESEPEDPIQKIDRLFRDK